MFVLPLQNMGCKKPMSAAGRLRIFACWCVSVFKNKFEWGAIGMFFADRSCTAHLVHGRGALVKHVQRAGGADGHRLCRQIHPKCSRWGRHTQLRREKSTKSGD